MWFEGSRLDSIRHECKREDDIRRWGWTEFEEGSYGKQSVREVHNHVGLSMVYLKDGDDWVLTINGTALKESSTPRNVSLIFYLSVNGENATLSLPSLSHKEKHTVGLHLPYHQRATRDPSTSPSTPTTTDTVASP